MTENERLELARYRLERAKETLKEVDLLVENKFWSTAINRIYYACFYAVSGLLLKNEVKAQSHAGIRQMFGLHYVKTSIISKELGKFYSHIFNLRQTGDYDDFIEFDRNDVIINLDPARELIHRIEDLLKK